MWHHFLSQPTTTTTQWHHQQPPLHNAECQWPPTTILPPWLAKKWRWLTNEDNHPQMKTTTHKWKQISTTTITRTRGSLPSSMSSCRFHQILSRKSEFCGHAPFLPTHLAQTLSRTIPTTLSTIPYLGTPCPNIANPRNTLPWCSQPQDRPFTLVFPSPWYFIPPSLPFVILLPCYPLFPYLPYSSLYSLSFPWLPCTLILGI